MNLTSDQRASTRYTAPRSRAAQVAGVVADVRIAVLACVVAVTPWNPTWALRQGAALAAVLLLLSLPLSLRGRLSSASLLAGLYGMDAWLSTWWTSDAASTALGWRNTAACVVLFWSARVSVRSRRGLSVTCAAFLAGCGIGVARLWSQNGLTLHSLRYGYDASADRLGIEGLNLNAFAYALALGSVALALLVACRAEPRSPMVLVLIPPAWLAMFAGVQSTGTRGALAAMVLGVAWLAACRIHARPYRLFRALAVVAVVAAASIFFGLSDGLLRHLAGPSTRETGNLNGRLLIWPVARDRFYDHVWIGSGLDALVDDTKNSLHIAAHNVPLDVAAGLGVVGLALLLALVVSSMREAGAARSQRNATLAGMFLAVATPIALTGYVIEFPALWIMLALVSRRMILEARRPGETADSPAERRLSRTAGVVRADRCLAENDVASDRHRGSWSFSGRSERS